MPELSHETYWWIAIGLGAVVILVAVALLEYFTRLVEAIEEAAKAIWITGKQTAANTATSWMLGQTVTHLDTLTEEAGHHLDMLGDGGGT